VQAKSNTMNSIAQAFDEAFAAVETEALKHIVAAAK
jgi:hypothetical protein